MTPQRFEGYRCTTPQRFEGCDEAAASSNTSLQVMGFLRVLGLFVITAVAEIVGCYLTFLWLRERRSAWLLVPAIMSLALFAWLLTLHPAAAGRVYAAYGGVYVFVAIMWLWKIDRVPITAWDLVGAAVSVAGMGIIVYGGWRA